MAKKESLNRESLEYHPTKVSWATSEFLDTPPRAASRVFLYMVIACAGAATAYSAWSQVAISVDSRGKIVARQGSIPVKSQASFRVGKLHVEDGQRVEPGDLLVEGDGRLSDQDFVLVENHHKILTDLLTRQKGGRCRRCLIEMRDFAGQAFAVETSGPTRDLLSQVRQLVLDYLVHEESFGGVAATTSSERRRIAIATDKLEDIRSRGAGELLARQVETLESEIAQARSVIADRRQALELQISQARNRLEVSLGGLLEAIDRERALQTIAAPAGGTVANLSVSGAGELVSPAEPVLEILRLESGMIAHLYVANKDISQITPGMSVRVKLDAFPEREFGAVAGEVESIPTDVVPAERAEAAAVYEVPVVLAAQSFTKNEEEHPFRLGMTLSGLILVKHESLLAVGLRKIFHLKDELFE